MKKRNKPIFLVAVFVLLAGGAIAMNTSLLSMPKTEEEFQKQAADQQAQIADTNSSHDDNKVVAGDAAAKAKKDVGGVIGGDGDGSLVSPKGDTDTMGVNTKAKDAVDPNGSKIAAPLNIKNKQRRQDRTSVAVQGQWYRPESGSNQEHPGH